MTSIPSIRDHNNNYTNTNNIYIYLYIKSLKNNTSHLSSLCEEGARPAGSKSLFDSLFSSIQLSTVTSRNNKPRGGRVHTFVTSSYICNSHRQPHTGRYIHCTAHQYPSCHPPKVCLCRLNGLYHLTYLYILVFLSKADNSFLTPILSA